MTDLTPERLVALSLAERASRLALLARTVVDQQAVGSHPSRIRGRGAVFAEHRPYATGDDLRRVDWRASARSERVVVRRHDVERRSAVWMLVDTSASMEFGTVEPPTPADIPVTKSEAAAMAAAVLALPMLRSGDRVTVGLVGQRVRRFPVRRGEAQLGDLCTDLAGSLPADQPAAALEHAVAMATSGLGARGRIVVITDALDDDHAWIERLGEARARGSGAAVLQVLDRSELELTCDEPSLFVEPEQGSTLRTDPRRVRRIYRSLIRRYVDGIRGRLSSAGVDHRMLLTGVSLREALARGAAGETA